MAAGALDDSSIATILLVRIRCGEKDGCTAAQILKDLQDFVSHRLSAGEWRTLLNSIIDDLINEKLVKSSKLRLQLTDKGRKSLQTRLPVVTSPRLKWSDAQSAFLVAAALNIFDPSEKLLQSLKTADGLKAAILKSKFDLQLHKEIPSLTQLRTSLALNAVEKGFGEDISTEFSPNMRIPEKLALYLASRLLSRRRRVTSTSQLLSLLASEAVNAPQSNPKSLRLALMREYVMPKEHQNQSGEEPDLQGFAKTVRDFARNRATGWPGHKRAYISHVWQTLQTQGPDWSLDEGEFKKRLAEAHREGYLSLAIADLRDKKNIRDVQASATKYKNSEWHLIRIED